MMTATRLICIVLACHAFVLAACGGGPERPDPGAKSDRGDEPTFARQCTLTELRDSTVFEESLSIDEWPDISIERAATGELEFTIGASLFVDGEDGFALSLETGPLGFVAARIVHESISYGIDAIDTQGMITVTEPEQVTKIVGDLDCPL